MSTELHPTRKILVGVDFTELGERALRSAFALASAAGDTQVHALWVRPGLEGVPVTARKVEHLDEEIERLRAHVDATLDAWLREHGDAPVPEVSVHETTGAPAAALVRYAAALRAGLIVVGTRGRRGLSRAILGSVAGEVVERASCPVLVVRPIEHEAEEAVAEIAPLCSDCAARRAETNGEEPWCARHAERHPRAHAYGYAAPSTATARPWGFS